jgi:hypothetical protein
MKNFYPTPLKKEPSGINKKTQNYVISQNLNNPSIIEIMRQPYSSNILLLSPGQTQIFALNRQTLFLPLFFAR